MIVKAMRCQLTVAAAQDIIVSETRFERTEGLYAWGRSSKGGYSPNNRVQFLGNTVVEGNHLWNYNGSYPYGYQPLGPASKTAEPLKVILTPPCILHQ